MMTKKIKNHLTKKEQLEIAEFLREKKQALYTTLLSMPQCVDVIITEYNRREGRGYGAIAKLSLHYNASVKGRSRKVGAAVRKHMEEAKKNIQKGNRKEAAKSIIAAELHPRTYFSKRMREASLQSKKVRMLYAEIDERREELVRSIVGETEEIAERYTTNLIGDVISYDDVLQEALLLAHQYTLVYDPQKGARLTKWSSFAYAMIDKAIRNYVAETTRNVPIPRVVQDRYRIVKRVLDKVNTEDRQAIAAMANKSIVDKRGKIKEEELFTPEEVDNLLATIGSNIVSLDSFVQDGEERYRTLSEAIDSGCPTGEDMLGYEAARNTLRQRVREVLTPVEYELISLRYGFDRDTGHRTLAEVERDFSLEYSRPYITSIIDRAEKKLYSERERFTDIKTAIYTKPRS